MVREIAAGHGGGEFQWATLQEERSRLWTPRHHAYFASLQLKAGSRSVTTRCLRAAVGAGRVRGGNAGRHAGRTACSRRCSATWATATSTAWCWSTPKDAAETAAAEAFSHRLVQRALRHGGTSTGEHGVGLHKMRYLVEEHGQHAVALMRSIKHALDPDNIFNPGKVVDF